MFNYSILYRFLTRAFVLLLILLILPACSLRSIRVVQERQFKTMCAQLRQEMVRRSLLDEQGNYLSNPFSALTSGKDYGNILFRHLSPSFRYAADNPMSAPKTFAESAPSRRDVRIRDYGFTLKQGLDTIDLNLIAQGDWDGNGQKEWLLSCNVTSGDAPVSRVYYLALTDLETEGVLTARTLAVFECVAYDCSLHLPQAGNITYSPEAPVIESMPGQRAITTPPANSSVPPKAGTSNPGVLKKRSP